MKPELIITIFQKQMMFKSYSFMMLIGILLILLVSIFNIYQARLPMKSSLLCILSMILGVLLGARTLNVLINWDYYMANKSRILALNISGFSLMGGLVLAGLVSIVVTRLLEVPFWELGDAIAPGLGLGLIAMRIGCFLNGCCYGLPTQLPWAVSYPYDSFAYKYYLGETLSQGGFSIFKLARSPGLHPTQIYEIIGTLIAISVAVRVTYKKKTSGLGILSFSMIFTLTRLINHFFRVHPRTNHTPFLFYPLIYILIMALLAFLTKKIIGFYSKLR